MEKRNDAIGQEEFFQKISEVEREAVKKWLETKGQRSEEKGIFLESVQNALQEVNYDFKIATLEPSVKQGRIQYVKNAELTVGILPKDWEKMCQDYAPANGSRMATLQELILFYAWRIAKGYWRFTYVAVDSSQGGNYYDCLNPYPLTDLRKYRHELEPAGARECGGYRDGIGNTAKIVKKGGKYKVIGGCYKDSGKIIPVATAQSFYGRCKNHIFCTPCVVLTK